jgi:palmitoyl-protein thioesterase
VVGLSQGGLLARSIVEECDTNKPVRNFATLGGPHRGVAASPNCFSGFYCDIINYVIDTFVYFPTIQDYIAPASYFRDPTQLDTYYKYSIFLPYLNNEVDFNQTYKDRMVAVNAAMFGMFTEDTVIDPPETAIFGEMQEDRSVKDVHDTDLFKNDLIGLKQLEEANKITWKKLKGNHLQFTEDFIQHELIPFLKQ